MATSGSANYTVSGGDICNAAYRIVNNANMEYTLLGHETAEYLQALNMLVKNLMGPPSFLAKGMKTWQKETGSITLTEAMFFDIMLSAYTFTFDDDDVSVSDDTITKTGHGLDTGAAVTVSTTGSMPAPLVRSTTYYAIRINANVIKLATTASNAAAGTAIDLTEAPITFDFIDANVTVASDNIAETAHGLVTTDAIALSTTGTLPGGLSISTTYYVIRVDADTIRLATSSANASAGTQIDITSAAGGGTHTLTGGGTHTLSQASNMAVKFPVEIQGVNYKDISGPNETPLFLMTEQDAFQIGNKSTKGTPVRYYYERMLDRGRLHIDVIPADSIVTAEDTLEVSYLAALEDFDTSANDPYFPQEWFRPLKWLLAQEMHPEAGKAMPAEVAALAVQSTEAANTVAPDKANMAFEPNNPDNW